MYSFLEVSYDTIHVKLVSFWKWGVSVKDHLKLVSIEDINEEQIRDFYDDWKAHGERITPSGLRSYPDDFESFQRELALEDSGEGLKPGRVRNGTYFLLRGNSEIVGATNIRYDLTEDLEATGGHVGYGVKPSVRGRGYATYILRKALGILKQEGVERALVAVNSDNLPSEKVIKNNGGKQAESVTEPWGNIVDRYWIDLN
ncbi:GNAT family N-acetyltransferase [Halalkalibacillus halophilus]|uniref:GNAT family N-acetyltransferase n=1 Tax=Halalkalibacillus halophilus TaxID=392827 RepID=UPI0003FF7A1A|nr:GNAT family N-acetyltransferase [Halalkalibacillus halophilus]